MLLCIDTSFCPGSAPGQMSLYVLECRETAAGHSGHSPSLICSGSMCPCASVLELEDSWPW